MLAIALGLIHFAPQLVGLLMGSKAEAVASKVVDIAQTVTGTSTPADATAALQADPDLAYKFQAAVLDQQVDLQKIAADVEKAKIAADVTVTQSDAGDRANARQMALGNHDNTARNLAYMYTVALFGVIGAHFVLVFTKTAIEPAAFNILGNIAGVLIAMVLGSKEYFFGRSQSEVKQAAAITGFATDPDTTVVAAKPVQVQTSSASDTYRAS